MGSKLHSQPTRRPRDDKDENESESDLFLVRIHNTSRSVQVVAREPRFATVRARSLCPLLMRSYKAESLS